MRKTFRTIELEINDDFIVVEFWFSKGMPGDGYLTPDDPDEIKIVNVSKCDADNNVDEDYEPSLTESMLIHEEIRSNIY